IGIAHVAAQSVHALVPRYVHHLEDARTAQRGRCEKARTQRMTAEICGIEPDAIGADLHDISDRAIRQPRATESAALAYRSEHGPGSNARGIKPSPHRLHRAGDRARDDRDRRPGALLVRLRSADMDAQPAVAELQIRDIEGHELAAAEGAGEAEQEQRTV